MKAGALVVMALLGAACPGADVVPSEVSERAALAGPAPLPWPARLEDLAWLEGRWAGVDAAGVCHIEHWLAPRHGAMFVVRSDGTAQRIERVTVAMIDTRAERAATLAGRRYMRAGDVLTVDDTRMLTRVPGLAGCP